MDQITQQNAALVEQAATALSRNKRHNLLHGGDSVRHAELIGVACGEDTGVIEHAGLHVSGKQLRHQPQIRRADAEE